MMKKSFKNKIKREEDSWQLTAKCSTNHADLLVIVTSHGSLAITSPWLQEAIQNMAYKLVSHIQNLHQEQANINLRSSKSLEGSMKYERVNLVSKLDVRTHHHEPSMALARAWPCRGY